MRAALLGKSDGFPAGPAHFRNRADTKNRITAMMRTTGYSLSITAQMQDYLATRGVATSRMTTDGRGEREPVAGNDTEAGRARNRRVEIFVTENPA